MPQPFGSLVTVIPTWRTHTISLWIPCCLPVAHIESTEAKTWVSWTNVSQSWMAWNVYLQCLRSTRLWHKSCRRQLMERIMLSNFRCFYPSAIRQTPLSRQTRRICFIYVPTYVIFHVECCCPVIYVPTYVLPCWMLLNEPKIFCCHTTHVCLFAYDRTKEQFKASTSSTNFDSTYVQTISM